jgi:hypothetical protein
MVPRKVQLLWCKLANAMFDVSLQNLPLLIG